MYAIKFSTFSDKFYNVYLYLPRPSIRNPCINVDFDVIAGIRGINEHVLASIHTTDCRRSFAT